MGTVFVTYQSNVTVLSPSNGTTSTNFTLEGINVTDGEVVWSDVALPPVRPLFGAPSAMIISAAPYAAFAAEYIRQSTYGLTLGLYLVVVNGSTGDQLGSYNSTVAPSGPLDPSTGMTITGASLVMWFTTWISTASTTYDVVGLSFPSVQYRWNYSVTLPGGGGWSSSDSRAASYGGDALMEAATGPYGGNGSLFLINGTTGHILLRRGIPTSAIWGSTVLGDSYYYLNQTTSSLRIDSINLTSGNAGPSVIVRNVGDNEYESAGLFGVDSTLLVASYSPRLSYAAYSVAGSELWQIAFPWSSDCWPQNSQPAVGPCTTLLKSPIEAGPGSVLLESRPTVLYSGATYTEEFDLVSASTGALSWNYNYTFSFGQKYWSWQQPEPSFEVRFFVGGLFLYVVTTPSSTLLGCGTI